MMNNESTTGGLDQHGHEELKTLDPNRFEREAEHAALSSDALERAQDDGWNSNSRPEAGDPCAGESQNPSELVASAWRVLPAAYAFPHEREYRAAAADHGREVTSTVQSEDGGYRHELVLESGTPTADKSGEASLE